MKAIITKGGQLAAAKDTFSLRDVPTPAPEAHDLLVRITALGMNPVDTKVRMRKEGDLILGWDACGIIEQTGNAVSHFSKGDRVFYSGDVTRSGTNCEFHLVDERIVAKAPTTLDDADAAAMPLTSITAWEILFDRLRFIPQKNANAGQSILIIGGAGGVGSIAIQLANWAGLTVYATASREESAKWCRTLGAKNVINHHTSLSQELSAIGVPHVDAILCTTHLEQHWRPMAECIRPQGKVAFIDDPLTPLDITVFKTKSVSLHWELMFTRSMFQTEDMPEQGRILHRIATLLEEDFLTSTRSETLYGLTAENIQKMHLKQESASMKGKQVLLL